MHKPVSCNPKKVQVEYVDIKPYEELKKEYCEINPKDILPVDHIDNGETLDTFANESLDFVINSHTIEHTEGPIASLNNWFRVLRPDGMLYLIVPDMRYNFDSRRKLTDFNHLLNDHRKNPESSRSEHYLEWADLVECCQVKHIKGRAEQLQKQQYRIHFHVWTPTSFLAFLISYQDYGPDFEIIHIEQNEDEFIVLLRKVK